MLHGKMTANEQIAVYRELKLMGTCIVYMTPERAAQPRFREFVSELLYLDQLAYIIIDEAHCIVTWGRDFRKDYIKLSELRMLTNKKRIPWLALTATATPSVQDHIRETLRFDRSNCATYVSDPFRRNIFCDVKFRSELDDTCSDMVDLVKKCLCMKPGDESWDGCAIIYCHRIQDTMVIAVNLRRAGLPCQHYNGQMSHTERKTVQESWTRGDYPVIVATNAFGMGIDKPDVRCVIHNNVPLSPHAWLQEFGRAGRDGKQSYARIYFDTRQLIDHALIMLDELTKRKNNKDDTEAVVTEAIKDLDDMARICLTPNCRHLQYRNHFGFEDGLLCKDMCEESQCDACRNPKDTQQHLANHLAVRQRKQEGEVIIDGVSGELSGYCTSEWPTDSEECRALHRMYQDQVLTVSVPSDDTVLDMFNGITFDKMKETQRWLTRRQRIPNLMWLNPIYLNHIQMIQGRAKENSDDKYGMLQGPGSNYVHLRQEDEGEEVKRPAINLGKVQLTEENYKRRREESEARIQQNGAFHIAVEVILQTNVVDDNLANSMIPQRIKIKYENNVDGQISGIQYLEPCVDERGQFCDLETCQRQHQRSSELVGTQEYAKPFMVPTATKSICDKAAIIVNKALPKHWQYDLWIEHSGNKVALVGNIHPDIFEGVNCDVSSLGGEQVWTMKGSRTDRDRDLFKQKLQIAHDIELAVSKLYILQPTVALDASQLQEEFCLERHAGRASDGAYGKQAAGWTRIL